MKFSLSAALFLFLSFTVQAQFDYRDGYVILTNGDSINGKVIYGNFEKRTISFKFKPQSGETVTYLPAQVKAYGYLQDKRFESKVRPQDSVSNSRVFMEVLVKGYMSLLKHNDDLYLESKENKLVFIPHPTSKEVQVNSKTYKTEQRHHLSILSSYLSGCSLALDAVRYEESEISELVQQYNSCHKQPYIYYKKLKKALKLTPQIMTGLQFTNLIREKDNKSMDNSVSPMFGVSFDLSAPRGFDRFYLSTEFLYSRQVFQYYETAKWLGYPGGTYHYDVHIEQTTVKLPIGFRYNLMQDNHALFLKVGWVFGLVSNLKIDQKAVLETVSGVRTSTSSSKEYKDHQEGFFGSVGFTKAFTNKKAKGFVELRYESMKTMNFIDSTSPYTNTSFYVVTGIRF